MGEPVVTARYTESAVIPPYPLCAGALSVELWHRIRNRPFQGHLTARYLEVARADHPVPLLRAAGKRQRRLCVRTHRRVYRWPGCGHAAPTNAARYAHGD